MEAKIYQLQNAEVVDFNGLDFVVKVPGSYGVVNTFTAPPSLIREAGLIEPAVQALADAWADSAALARGEIIDRRIVTKESGGFLGFGAGKFEEHQALVRLSADWEDWRGDSCELRKAGSEVWIAVNAPIIL